ncbi:hypothetical protein C2S52_012567 [Perilla frutescens var. hirtella]|nr:hypothetical protein C2S52_012567 [Perilla frutescens var. hirtella]
MASLCIYFAGLLLLLLNSSITLSLATTIFDSTIDQHALLAFKNSITSDPNGIFAKNWSSADASVCSWIGVTCDVEHKRVTALNISSFNLAGNLLTPHLGNLTFLRSLDSSFNNFTGEIPSWFAGNLLTPHLGNLTFLRSLDSSFNNFTGEIPSWFGGLSELQYLNLNNNTFSVEIGNLSSLEILNLAGNKFTGSIPSGIFTNMSSLMEIDLRFNMLSGQLPSDMCRNTPKLRRIYLRKNELYGQTPASIYKCRELEELILSYNQFYGSIPREIGSLSMLTTLSLFSNDLKGEIPKQVGNLTSLRHLYLYENNFTGEIPQELANVKCLEGLSVRDNSLYGPIPSFIFNISTLKLLTLSFNQFYGTLPSNMGLSLFNLQQLYLSHNSLSGTIPSSITNASQLIYLEMNRNSFSGSIPSFGDLRLLQGIRFWGNNLTGAEFPTQEMGFLTLLTNCIYLKSLDISNNPLNGYIPLDLCGLSNLGELNLSSNMFIGPIPECIGDLKFMKILYFESNKLNSSLPSNFWNLRDLVRLNLSSNYMSGHISPQIGNLKAVRILDLSSNQFSGDIPGLIDGCQSLAFLFLSNNNFSGYLPQSLGNIRGLQGLDLSNNNLSGVIPRALEDLLFLQYFDVSYNRLEGEIPNEGSFANFTAQSFVHNHALCGIARFQVPPCSKNLGSRKKLGVLFLKYILPCFVSAIILAIILLFLIRKRVKKNNPTLPENLLGISWRRISYEELICCTSEFSETNLLGRGSFGSVFKGILSDGLNIAVKVFHLELEGAMKSFDTECEILSSIRHRNLLRIVGCCSNVEFKAIILAYKPNESLEKWLYSDNYCLDLLQRLKVAIDVALALEYLHHGHTFTVVHCDIKPSNVLLDEHMVAHVGDFGIAKLFDEGKTMIHTQTLATIGYAAPEYGSEGKVSTSGDVFSYGITLLEMFTSKKPTDNMFDGEMSLKEWVSEALQENAVWKVVAPGLLSRDDQDFDSKQQFVSSVFELTMKCVAFSPEERINMIQIVVDLHKIKAKFTAQGVNNMHGSSARGK